MPKKPVDIDLINIEKLKPNEKIIHEELPEYLVSKAKEIFEVIRELEFSFAKNSEEWVEGFKKELYPEREIAIWELIIDEFLNEIQDKNLSLEGKREIFKKILIKSFFGESV